MTDTELVMDRLSWRDDDAVIEFTFAGSLRSLNRIEADTRVKALIPGLDSVQSLRAINILRPFLLGNQLIESVEDLANLSQQFSELMAEKRGKVEELKNQMFHLTKEIEQDFEDFLATK